MSFEEFENVARLYVVGALEADEMAEFKDARRQFGQKGEDCIGECRKLNAAFALSLHPQAPHPDTRAKLLDRIHDTLREESAPMGIPRLGGNGRAGGI